MTKNVAWMSCFLRSSRTRGVVSGNGPSSNVSVTNFRLSPARRCGPSAMRHAFEMLASGLSLGHGAISASPSSSTGAGASAPLGATVFASSTGGGTAGTEEPDAGGAGALGAAGREWIPTHVPTAIEVTAIAPRTKSACLEGSRGESPCETTIVASHIVRRKLSGDRLSKCQRTARSYARRSGIAARAMRALLNEAKPSREPVICIASAAREEHHFDRVGAKCFGERDVVHPVFAIETPGEIDSCVRPCDRANTVERGDECVRRSA